MITPDILLIPYLSSAFLLYKATLDAMEKNKEQEVKKPYWAEKGGNFLSAGKVRAKL